MKKMVVALALLLGLGFVGACSKTDESPDALMKTGYEALYTNRDPAAAVTAFKKLLEKNPNHYGGNYQLAVALDRSGRSEEAIRQWQKTLEMAERFNDKPSIETARKRLGMPPPGPQDVFMKEGIDALYGRRDYEAAATAFRKVLELNPNHYGATYQLAAALDRSGKAAEARPLWEKVLKMAEGYKDKATADTARARLVAKP